MNRLFPSFNNGLLVRLFRRVKLGRLFYRVTTLLKHKYASNITKEDALRLLNSYCPDKGSSCLRDSKVETVSQQYNLQVIVPIYNAADYLYDCVESILSQKTKYTFLLQLIDDGSTDGSGKIADCFIKDPRVQIIHQENRGISGARNRGLMSLCGEYILFVDADDILMPGALESLLDTAYINNADIVQGGFYYWGHHRNKPYFCYSRTEKISDDKLSGYPWGKVYHQKLFVNYKFPEKYWFEDTMLFLIIHSVSSNLWCVPNIVYKYRFNPNGICQTSISSIKAIDTFWVTSRAIQDRQHTNIPISARYISKLSYQFIINEKRVINLSKEVRYAIFLLSAELFLDHFSRCSEEITNKTDLLMYNLFSSRDFSKFEVAVKWLL